MRGFLVVWIGVAAAYWVDQTYYNGVYSRPVTEMVHQIILSYR
jgi:hypothetical protein